MLALCFKVVHPVVRSLIVYMLTADRFDMAAQ